MKELTLVPIVLTALAVGSLGHPGLLRVPKVYNAVITSNQNLAPSRAYPVVQPVIHRTAIGYVPPFYYTQIEPEVVNRPHDPANTGSDAETRSEGAAGSLSDGGKSEKPANQFDANENGKHNGKDNNVAPEDGTKKKNDVPLSFYPNYHSLYYDPYFYAYNGFNPQLSPATYYIDYQPYGPLAPLPPPPPPKSALPGHLLPSYNEEKKNKKNNENADKIPDVPPPPVPTSAPKDT